MAGADAENGTQPMHDDASKGKDMACADVKDVTWHEGITKRKDEGVDLCKGNFRASQNSYAKCKVTLTMLNECYDTVGDADFFSKIEAGTSD